MDSRGRHDAGAYSPGLAALSWSSVSLALGSAGWRINARLAQFRTWSGRTVRDPRHRLCTGQFDRYLGSRFTSCHDGHWNRAGLARISYPRGLFRAQPALYLARGKPGPGIGSLALGKTFA